MNGMESTKTCCVILFLAVVVIYQLYKRAFRYWERRGVYTQPPTFPFGNAKNLIMRRWSLGVEFTKLYTHLKEKSLPFGGYYFLFKPIFVANDLDTAKKLLITDFEHFTDHSMSLQEFDPITNFLFSMKGAQWKTMRAKLTPAFTAAKNRMLFDTVLKCTEQLLQILDEAADNTRKVDVNDLASRFSIDVISSCAFGFESNSLKNPNSEIRLTALKFLKPSVRNAIVFFLGWMFPSVLEVFKIKLIDEEVTKFFKKLIQDTVTYRETSGVIRPDFVHLLLQIRDSVEDQDLQKLGKPQLTIDEMAAQSLNFFFGGYETSSLTIMYCLYELAKNEEIQDKARDELQTSLLEQEEEKLNYTLIQSLSYLDQVVYETLRKYPPLPMLMRECTQEYTIPGTNVKIDKGCLVSVPTLGIQRDPEIYPNPDEFDPERFSPKGLKGRHPCAWTPFGSGPRTCIAYQFGVMEIKIAIASLLHRYRFSVNSETEQPPKLSRNALLLVPESTIWINLEKL